MDIDDINFGRAQMCAVGNAEPEPTPKPAAACAQCVKIGDPTGWFMKDYGKCYGGNSQCERKCMCRDARSYGLDICDGCNIKYCIAHGRRSQHNCNLSALQCDVQSVQMCAAGAFELQEDAEDTQDAVQHDSDKLELEELEYRWIAAYQDHTMAAVVICTSNEQAEADLSAGLSEMPDGGNGAIVIDCGSDKERAYTMVEEINGRYFPPSAAQTTPIDVGARGTNTAAFAFMDNLVDIDDPNFGMQMGAVNVAEPTPSPIPSLGTPELCDTAALELQDDTVQIDSQEQELEEADFIWHVARQDYTMAAVVICTSNEQTEADLRAGLDEMPDGGKDAVIVNCGKDKEHAYKLADEINQGYFPPLATQATPLHTGAPDQATPAAVGATQTRAQRVLSTPMPIGVVGTGTDSASVDGYSPAGSVALRNIRQTPAADQVWDAETMTAAANANLEDMRATYERLGIVIDGTFNAASASPPLPPSSPSPPPPPLPPPQLPHTVTTSRRPGAPPPTHLMGATPMPTSCELTSTNARRNAVPQVINLARKGKPSPSAGGGERTSNDVGARGQATPEVTNSAISTRAQRVPSTPMPSGASATPTRTNGYSPASTAALRSMQQTPVAEQQAWDAEKMTAAANANLDEMQTMYKRLGVVVDDDATEAVSHSAAASPPSPPSPPPLAPPTSQPSPEVSTLRRPGAPSPKYSVGPTPMPTSRELSAAPLARSALPPQQRLRVINSARTGVQRPDAGGGNEPAAPVTARAKTEPEPEPKQKPQSAEPQPELQQAATTDSTARLALWMVMFSITYGISGRTHISSIACVGAATLTNYSTRRCPVTLVGVAEMVRNGIMRLVMNYTTVGVAILCALVVHYVLYAEPVNARAAAVSMPMMENPAAMAYLPGGWYTRPSSTGAGLMSKELTVHGGSNRSIQSKENVCRPQEMRETTPALRSPPPSSPWPPPSPTPPLLYSLEDGLYVGYSGGESGAYEALGNDRCQPGYICFDSEGCRLIVTEPVRFIVGCFPGLQRTAGGGWRIPAERIPFSAEALAQKHPLALPQERPKPPNDGVVDIEQDNSTTELGDFDHDRLSYSKGLPLETEQTPQTDSRTTARSTEDEARLQQIVQPKVVAPTPQAIVPREVWPDYPCNEQGGRRWLVEVIGKDGKHSKCKFKSAIDSDGRSFQSEWIETSRLLPVDEQVETTTVTLPPSSPSPPSTPTPVPPTRPLPDAATTDSATASQRQRVDSVLTTDEVQQLDSATAQPTPDQWLVPNQNTMPYKPGADPLKEPARPQRDSKPVDRYTATPLAAQYCSAAGVGFTMDYGAPRPDTLYAEHEGMDDRFASMAQAFVVDENEWDSMEGTNYTGQTQEAFTSLPIEAQRAACVMADYTVLAAELGVTSPQAIMARETYAAAMFDAACVGISLPGIDQPYGATPLARDNASNPDAVGVAMTAATDTVFAAASQAGAPKQHREPCKDTAHKLRDGACNALPIDDIFIDEYDGHLIRETQGGCKVFTNGDAVCLDQFNELVLLSNQRTSPDIYSERQMKGPEWDEPKQIEINKLKHMFTTVAADDLKVGHLKPVDTMWTGRDKRDADRKLAEKKGRCVLRGDLHKSHHKVSENQVTAPVVRNTSAACSDAVGVLRCRHTRSGDVPTAYLQGDQTSSEQVLARSPHDFREFDERGVEILRLMNFPLYGQVDAGANWNRTFNNTMVAPRDGASSPNVTPIASESHEAEVDLRESGCAAVDQGKWSQDKSAGLGAERSAYDPCVCGRVINGKGDRIVTNVYVDDVRMYWDTSDDARAAAADDQNKLYERHKIKWGAVDAPEDYFLGANRSTSKERDVVHVSATSYIDSMVDRYLDNEISQCKERPASWGFTPADDTLTRAYEAAINDRTTAPPKLFQAYNSLVGSLRHAVKYRPEISAAMDLLGCCLTFPTEELLDCARHVLVYLGRTRKLGTTYSKHAPNASKLTALADANWRHTRSTSGYCIFLGGAVISSCCRQQGCIAMSTTEAELVALVALAVCAIELIALIGVLKTLGYEVDEPVDVGTDNKRAYDLCHRFTSAQNSRHIDRKLFKMRERRGAGQVCVRYVPTNDNTSDIFTKILSRQLFEKHRRTALNLAGAK